jgi:hypothetical protein
MKRSKVLIFLLLAVMMTGSLILSSCGATIEPINVTLIIEAGDEEILNVTMPISMKDPTVLALVSEAAAIYELNVTYIENVDSIAVDVNDIENYKTRTDENGIAYFWDFLVDGVQRDATTGGKANVFELKDGMVIKYVYTTFDPKSSK